MNIFDEWEGRDPLDFTNRPPKTRKKQTTPNPKKPFHKTPAGSAVGCVLWIFIIALVWNYFGKSDTEHASITPNVVNESPETHHNYRTITPEEEKFIGQHARYLEEQKERYLALINEPGFIQQGYKSNRKTWQEALLAELDKLTENVSYENHDYYQDVESATFELIDAIEYSDSWRRRSDFKEKVENFVRLFDERLTPYLQW